MAEPRLVENDITLDLEVDTPDALTTTAEGVSQSYRLLFMGLAVGAVIVALWLMFGRNLSNRDTVILSGEEIAELRPGAKVVLNGTPVGQVEQLEVRNGLPTARLQIDPDVLREVPSTSRFEVGSLNRLLPGNVGVKIVTTERNNQASPGAGWTCIRENLVDQSIVPTRTPLGFYAVLFLVVAVSILLLCLVIKVLKSTAFWTAVVVALIVVVLHAWHMRKLDDAARWGDDQLKASQTADALTR